MVLISISVSKVIVNICMYFLVTHFFIIPAPPVVVDLSIRVMGRPLMRIVDHVLEIAASIVVAWPEILSTNLQGEKVQC